MNRNFERCEKHHSRHSFDFDQPNRVLETHEHDEELETEAMEVLDYIDQFVEWED